MDKLNYCTLVKDLIQEHASERSPDDAISSYLVFDTERDRYLLLNMGWQGEKQFYACPIHIDVQDGKIWIHQDFTEEGLAQQLLDRGVPKTDIVLGFRAPYVRQFTGFATA